MDIGAWPGPRPTNISIKFEIRPKFAELWIKLCFTDYNKVMHTWLQFNCRDEYEMSLCSVGIF